MNILYPAAAGASRPVAPRIVTPILKDAVLAFAPVSCARVGASARGLAIHRAGTLDTPFEAVRLIAAAHDDRRPKDPPVLLLFVEGQPRPFIVSAFQIAFREFPGVLGDALAASFRRFLGLLVTSCPGVVLDQATWEFVQRETPLAPRTIDVLATSLARLLDSLPDAAEAGHVGPAAVAAGVTLAEPPASDAGLAAGHTPDVPVVWNAGDVVLGLYDVRQVHQSGGMGLVYRVWHRNWQTELAVKAPRPEFFRTEEDAAAFERECETWINLGLHPHTVSCYYVRRVAGVPHVFAEYVDGGSLEDWIKNGALYRGGPGTSLPRLLDIAIQFAWGLHFAHERGLIHQDVKPANVLVTRAGVAKVTDFGLAHARARVDDDPREAPAGASLVATFGGLTPAYCSPEQAALLAARRGGTPRDGLTQLTRRTDVWSWAVSLLEMFTGGVSWMAGQAAASALQNYLENGPGDANLPAMPAEISDLLRRCFSKEPSDRPATLLDVTEPLRTAYERCVGQPYPRRRPEPATLLADGLNNRAVSLLDIGRGAEAARLFDEALAADGGHIEATFNRALLRWRAGHATDSAIVGEVTEAAKSAVDARAAADLVGLIHLERCDADAALAALGRAADGCGVSDPQVRQRAEELRAHAARAVRVISPVPAPIKAVAVGSDGRTVLGGGLDGIVHIWDPVSVRGQLAGHAGWVTSVALTADSRFAVSGSVDDTVRVWDLSTGRCLQVLEGHADDVSAVAVEPSGRSAVSGGYDNAVRVWDLVGGRCLRRLEGHSDWISAVAASGDGRAVLSASYDGTIRVWDAPSGACCRVLRGHKGRVTAASMSGDARRAISGGPDGVLRYWDLTAGTCLGGFEGHTGEVLCAALSADGRFAVSGGADATVRVWDTASGRCLRTFDGHAREVRAVALSGDTSLAVSASADCSLRMWNVRSLCHGAVPAPPALSRVTSAEASLEGEAKFRALLHEGRDALAAGLAEQALERARTVRALPGRDRDPEAGQLWNDIALRGERVGLKSAWCLRVLTGQSANAKALAVTADWRLVAGAAPDGTLQLRELSTGRTVLSLAGHEHGISAIAALSDAERIASVGGDGRCCVWHVGSGTCEQAIEGFEPNGEGLAITGDGRWLVRGEANRVGLWEVATGRRVRTYPAPSGMLMQSVILLPDGDRAGAATLDYKTLLYELAGGRIVGRMDNCGPLTCSPDGRVLAAVGADAGVQRIVIWELRTGDRKQILGGHAATISAMAFSPDSRWLFSAGADNVVRVWDLSTGVQARVLEGFVHPVSTMFVSPDGTRAVLGCSDGSVQVWALDWELGLHPECFWDERALPLVARFVERHRPAAGELPRDRLPFDEEISLAVTRRGKPTWTPGDVDDLIHTLGQAGLGHVQRDGIVARLDILAHDGNAVTPMPAVAWPEAARLLRKGADRLEAEGLPVLASVPTQGGDLYKVCQIYIALWRALADTLESGKGAGGRSPSIPDLALDVFGNTRELENTLRGLASCPPHVIDGIARVRRLALDLMPSASLPEAVVFYCRKIRGFAESLEADFSIPVQPIPTAPLEFEKILRQLVGALREYPDCLARGLDPQGQPASRTALARLLGDIARGGTSDPLRGVYQTSFGTRFMSIWGALSSVAHLAEFIEAQAAAEASPPDRERAAPAPALAQPAAPAGSPARAFAPAATVLEPWSEPAPPAAVPQAGPAPSPPVAPPAAPPAPPPPAAFECPKCGAIGAQGPECRGCGLLFARYQPGPVLKRAAERLRMVAKQLPRMPPMVVESAKFWETLPAVLQSGRSAEGEPATPYQVALLVRDNVDMMEDRLSEAFGECPAQLRSLLPEMRRLSRHLIGDPTAAPARAALAGAVADAVVLLEAVFARPERPFPVTDQGLESAGILNFFVVVFKGFPGQILGGGDAGALRGAAQNVVNSCGAMLQNNVLAVIGHSCPSQFPAVFKMVNMIRTVGRIVSEAR